MWISTRGLLRGVTIFIKDSFLFTATWDFLHISFVSRTPLKSIKKGIIFLVKNFCNTALLMRKLIAILIIFNPRKHFLSLRTKTQAVYYSGKT